MREFPAPPPTTGHFSGLDDAVVMPRHEVARLERYGRLYEALARAECRRQGIDPDDIIADGGHLAWHLVGYEAAVKEMPDVR